MNELTENLFEASKKGKINEVKDLIRSGANINISNGNGNVALHEAAWEGHIEVVNFLVVNGADLNVYGTFGNTPLLAALNVKENLVARFLIKSGADTNCTNADNESPLKIAICNGNLDMVKFLIDHEADVNAASPYGWTALMSAVQEERRDVVTFLLQQGAKVNCNMDQWTPLSIAASRGNLDLVELIAQQDLFQEKNTALVKAVENNHFDVFEYLLSNGADIDCIDKADTLRRAAKKGRLNVVELLNHPSIKNAVDHLGRTPLMYAAMGGNNGVVGYLLHHCAEINLRDGDGWSALHYACSGENNDSVRLLMKDGADVNLASDYSVTPLMLANIETMDHLVTNGAEVDSRDYEGKTALFRAAEEGRYLEVKYLVEDCDADPEVRSYGGFTALTRAADRGWERIVKYLKVVVAKATA